MDQNIRNKLRTVVTQCRKLLEEAVAQVLQGQFGISASGKKDEVQVEDESSLKLTPEDQGCRRDLVAHLGHIQALGYKAKDALAQLVREIAFTHLNRLCAYKMMEARAVWIGGKPFREAVSRGVKSQGFQFYLADDDHTEDKKLFETGHQDIAYRHFPGWLGELLSEEIGVLFSSTDPANRLFPTQRTLDNVLALLNSEDLSDIWTEDETIGWVYQYFTPKELRDQARKESQAPRNSYELAFRNQFFTPRYVVEFLTDNTLGRIWYEMRKGDTKLKDQCRYMVRRPTEIFLTQGQTTPEPPNQEDLLLEDLLKQPVHIPHRPKKDPRELLILDPACGSGHFLLYCFDLLLTIYEEAYADPDLGQKLKEEYPTLEALRWDVPRLILAHNLHGIDIDLRASQIAALVLWLRSQRAYRDMSLKQNRPDITKSNIVCAEPMPGEESMFKEFVGQLEPKLLGQLVEVVFEKMKLAGEAGSLLKIEEDIRETVADAKKQWVRETTLATDRRGQPLLFTKAVMDRLAGQPAQHSLFDLSDITDDQFFEQAETRVVEALRRYAENAQNGQHLQRRLFTEDVVRGFSFVDVCRKRFDVVLMNPPFGASSKPSRQIIEKQYPRSKHDMYAAFVDRGLDRLRDEGLFGAITSRTGFFLTTFQHWREELLLDKGHPIAFVDLGYGVLDTAVVETAAYCIDTSRGATRSEFVRLLDVDGKAEALSGILDSLRRGQPRAEHYSVIPESFHRVPGSPFAYWVSNRVRKLFDELPRFESTGRFVKAGLITSDDFRFIRNWWEVPPSSILALGVGIQKDAVSLTHRGKRWAFIARGGDYSPYFRDLAAVVDWEKNGYSIRQIYQEHKARVGGIIKNPDFYFRGGITWPLRGARLSAQPVPRGSVFSVAGKLATSDDSEELYPLVGLMNSLPFDSLLRLSAGESRAQFEVGLISKVPVPKFIKDQTLTFHSREACLAASYPDLFDECKHLFVTIRLIAAPGLSLDERLAQHKNDLSKVVQRLQEHQCHVDEIAFRLYGINPADRATMEQRLPVIADESKGEEFVEDDVDTKTRENDIKLSAIRELLSYSVGCVYGRWDVRYATLEKSSPHTPDPFDSLPVCSPGMLQGVDGLPSTHVPDGYPLRIDWDGILVDDPNHPDDVIRRVRDVLEVIWEKRADAIEKEAYEILGVADLREYFRRPGAGGFWDDHIKRYSKSRRNAPIYWLLQSSKKNYALWIYYHRLDKDILFKALLNYVEPKIRREESRLDELRAQKIGLGPAAKGAKKLDKDMDRQDAFLAELRDFEEKLRRAANLHLDSDLNDGVVLNIAPLRELVPWKESKVYWDGLMDGKCEWSSIGKQLREKGLLK